MPLEEPSDCAQCHVAALLAWIVLLLHVVQRQQCHGAQPFVSAQLERCAVRPVQRRFGRLGVLLPIARANGVDHTTGREPVTGRVARLARADRLECKHFALEACAAVAKDVAHHTRPIRKRLVVSNHQSVHGQRPRLRCTYKHDATIDALFDGKGRWRRALRVGRWHVGMSLRQACEARVPRDERLRRHAQTRVGTYATGTQSVIVHNNL